MITSLDLQHFFSRFNLREWLPDGTASCVALAARGLSTVVEVTPASTDHQRQMVYLAMRSKKKACLNSSDFTID